MLFFFFFQEVLRHEVSSLPQHLLQLRLEEHLALLPSLPRASARMRGPSFPRLAVQGRLFLWVASRYRSPLRFAPALDDRSVDESSLF